VRRIIYKTLKGQNFLSIGNDQIVIDFQSGFNLITGNNIDNPDRVNGIGKCVDENTEIDIQITDTTVLENFRKNLLPD
jgi:hypothetical protein